MKTLKPIIQTEEPDKYGRTVKVGIQDGPNTCYFQLMSIEEAEHLRDELTKFLSGAKQPGCFYIPEVSLNEMREQVKVGDRAICLGIGYPHWKGKIIEITAIFNDNKTIGFKSDSCGIRVDKEDFKYLPKGTEVIEIMGKCVLLKRDFMPIFQGCQCHKDCNCKEEFNKSKKKCTSYDVFTGKRTHSFNTLDKAMKAMKDIYALQTASNNKL